jgi:hypothetical protein
MERHRSVWRIAGPDSCSSGASFSSNGADPCVEETLRAVVFNAGLLRLTLLQEEIK